MIAALFNNNPVAIDKLIEARADINRKDIHENNILMLAASLNSNPKIIEKIIKLGIDINSKNKNGNTALMEAVNNIDPDTTAIMRTFN